MADSTKYPVPFVPRSSSLQMPTHLISQCLQAQVLSQLVAKILAFPHFAEFAASFMAIWASSSASMPGSYYANCLLASHPSSVEA